MPATVTRARREPLVIVETEGLTEEVWLDYRRKGIGGSDVAAVYGISPWVTTRELYYDKCGIQPAVQEDGNWVAMEVGHRLESLVAEVFRRKTGFKVWKDSRMFAHPDPALRFMQADLDYMVEDNKGRQGILEIKTTGFFNRDEWSDDTPPYHYELQARHYMAVMDLDFVWFACLYGNNESQFIMCKIERDLDIEKDMIAQESHFWTMNVLAGVEPPITEEARLALDCIRRHYGPAVKGLPAVNIPGTYYSALEEYLTLATEKRALDQQANELAERMKGLTVPIIDLMGNACQAECVAGPGLQYKISYSPRYRTGISRDALEKLKAQEPDIYDQYVSVSESRVFTVKPIET